MKTEQVQTPTDSKKKEGFFTRNINRVKNTLKKNKQTKQNNKDEDSISEVSHSTEESDNELTGSKGEKVDEQNPKILTPPKKQLPPPPHDLTTTTPQVLGVKSEPENSTVQQHNEGDTTKSNDENSELVKTHTNSVEEIEKKKKEDEHKKKEHDKKQKEEVHKKKDEEKRLKEELENKKKEDEHKKKEHDKKQKDDELKKKEEEKRQKEELENKKKEDESKIKEDLDNKSKKDKKDKKEKKDKTDKDEKKLKSSEQIVKFKANLFDKENEITTLKGDLKLANDKSSVLDGQLNTANTNISRLENELKQSKIEMKYRTPLRNIPLWHTDIVTTDKQDLFDQIEQLQLFERPDKLEQSQLNYDLIQALEKLLVDLNDVKKLGIFHRHAVTATRILEATKTLLPALNANNLTKDQMLNKVREFEKNIKKIDGWQIFFDVLWTVCAAAVGFIVGASVGMALGIAFGAWSGPGAFVTGALGFISGGQAGAYAAVAALTGATTIGLTAATGMTLFSTSKVEKDARVVNQLASNMVNNRK